mmetsp:Transcript_27845/g.55747  ORF Transcript_27845/g.55747 Transcript_27845/m.55747 type:complete len:1148 (-) Transcript_27845:67-3510(-)
MDQEEAPLPASEYPCCTDSLNSLPLHEQNDNDGTTTAPQQHNDPGIVASTLRQNSIHRWSLSTRTIAHYCRLEQIGEGTYGQVYRAQCLDRTLAHPAGGEIVALKKIRLHHPGYWGIPPTVLREIKILKQLQHKNLVKMFEVVSSKGAEELDWEDEREDEKRKKAKESKASSSSNNNHNSDKNNNSTPVLNSEDSNTKKNDTTTSSAITNTKPAKKKKDPMSDIDKLRESYKGNLFLSLEYISHDLTGLLDMAYKFSEVQVKSIARQLLQVLEFMHERNFVHRDLKTSNILITDNFELKLADFGLARCLDSSFMGRLFEGEGYSSGEGEFTNKVITLWYRPPELLLGETRYGCAVDIWSAGCIFAEIILGRPIFTGKAEMDQLKLIFDLIGTPTERSWEGFRELKLIRTGEFSIDKPRKPRLRDKYGEKIKPAAALGLLEKLLELDPKKRFTASRALNHRYFQASPVAPDDPKELGKIDLGGDGSGYHEFKTKKRRREAKAVAKMAEDEAKRQGCTVEKQKEAFDVAYREHLQKGASADKKKEEKKEKQQQVKQQSVKQQPDLGKPKREQDQKGKNDQHPPPERDQRPPQQDNFPPPPSRHPPKNVHPLMNQPPPNMGNHPRDVNRDMPHSRDLNRDMPPPRGDMRGPGPPRDMPPPRDMMGRGPRDMPHPGDMGRGPPGPRDMPHPPRDMMGRGPPGPRDMPHPHDMGRGPREMPHPGPRDMPHPFEMGRGGPRDMGRGHPNNNDRMDQGGPWNMNMGRGDGRRIPERMGDNWGPPGPPHHRDQRGPPPPDQQFRRDHYGPSNDQYGPRRPNGGDHFDPMNGGRNGSGPPNDNTRRGPPDGNFDRGRGPPDGNCYDDRGRGPPNRNHHDQNQMSQEEEFRSRRQHDDGNDRRRERSKDRARDSPDKGRKQDSRSARDDDRDKDRLKNNKDEKNEEERMRSRSPNRGERRRSRERSRDSSRGDKDRKKGHRRSHREDDDRRHRQEKERNDKKSERGEDDQSRRERKRSKDSDRDGGGKKRQKRSRHDKDSRRRDSSRSDDRSKDRSERDERRGDGRGVDRDRFTPPPGRQYDQYGNPVVADRDRGGQRSRDQHDESRDGNGRYGPSSQDWRPPMGRDGRPGDGPNWRPPMGRDGHPDDRRRNDDRRR